MLSEFEVIPIIFLGGEAFCARRYDDMKYGKRHKELQMADFLFGLGHCAKRLFCLWGRDRGVYRFSYV